MKTRQLGMHGPHDSAIGVGALSFSDFYGLAKDEGSHKILSSALDLDITILIHPTFTEMADQKQSLVPFLGNKER